jgi:hypothetical protein
VTRTVAVPDSSPVTPTTHVLCADCCAHVTRRQQIIAAKRAPGRYFVAFRPMGRAVTASKQHRSKIRDDNRSARLLFGWTGFPPIRFIRLLRVRKSVNITIEKREKVPFCVLGPPFRKGASWLKRHKTFDLSLLARKVHEPQ